MRDIALGLLLALVGCGFAVLVVILIEAITTRARRKARDHVSQLESDVLVRALRYTRVQRALDRAIAENERLAELANKRHELLVAACTALDLVVPDPARDAELLQAIRAAALQHQRGFARFRDELALRDCALAAIASMVLSESIAPGAHNPRDLVQMVDAHLAWSRPRGQA